MDVPHAAPTPSPKRPDPTSNRLMDLLLLGAEFLAGKGVPSPRLDAEILLASLLGLERVGLYLQHDRPLTDEEKQNYRALLLRRSKGEPLQYINGHAAFRDLELSVKPGVLIPRPETELLIDHAIRLAPKGGYDRAADIGTGSGAIALALLEEGVAGEVVAVDVSPKALAVATENARALGYEETGREPGELRMEKSLPTRISLRIRLVKLDAFTKGARLPGEPFPLILSNPPYVCEDEFAGLETNVRDHEPREALVSGGDGLDAHRALADLLPDWLQSGGCFLGEFGAAQGEEIRSLYEKRMTRVEIHRDLAGLDRMVEAWRE